MNGVKFTIYRIFFQFSNFWRFQIEFLVFWTKYFDEFLPHSKISLILQIKNVNIFQKLGLILNHDSLFHIHKFINPIKFNLKL